MTEVLGVTVEPADEPEAVARGADILVTSTNAREPVLFGDWLEPGQHVNAIGSNAIKRLEIDERAVTRSSFIATDALDQAKIECGDLVAVVEAGRLAWSDVHELGDVVAGKVSARTSDDDITLFESQGLAIEDVAAAKVVYEAGLEEGVGRDLEL